MIKKQTRVSKWLKLFIIIGTIFIIFLSWFFGTHTNYEYDDGVGDVFEIKLNWNNGKMHIHQTATYDISDEDNPDDIRTVETENDVTLTSDEMSLFKNAKEKNYTSALSALSMFICADQELSYDENNNPVTYRDAANELWQSIIDEKPYLDEQTEEEKEAEEFTKQFFEENEEYINNMLVKYGFDPIDFDSKDETPTEQIERQAKERGIELDGYKEDTNK